MQSENLDRLSHPMMAYYQETYKNSKRWTPECGSLKEKVVIIYAEQGFGDIIQFTRYIPVLKEQGCRIIYHCPQDLHRLFAHLGVEFLDKDDPDVVLPPHDYHILSFSLPFVLGNEMAPDPYLTIPHFANLGDSDTLKIGICWEGSPSNPMAFSRDCPLIHFRGLESMATKLFALQKEIHHPMLVDGCEDMELLGYPLKNFYDTATVINSLDLVVTVDTAVLHLAGAMGKKTFGLLNYRHDARWDVSNWYDSVTLVKLKDLDDWSTGMRTVVYLLRDTLS